MTRRRQDKPTRKPSSPPRGAAQMTPPAREERLAAYKSDLFAQFGRLGRAVSHPGRLELLDLLTQAERTVEDLVRHTGRSHSNVSQHLSVLKSARLVTNRKEGLFVFYRLADPAVAEFWNAFRRVSMRCMAGAREVVDAYSQEFDDAVKGGKLSSPVHMAELCRRLQAGDLLVLDVRPRVEFAAGHIPGAISIPFDELEERLEELPRDRDVIAYCRGPYCLMAREAVRLLEQRGIRARALEEGILEWRAGGQPVEST